MKRIVSVALPDWPIESRNSAAGGPSDGKRDEAAFALVENGPRGMRLTAVNRAASLLNIASGDPLADARAMHPALITAPATPAEDRNRVRRLARWLGRYGIARNAYGFVRESPSGYPVRCYALWVDISGVAHLYGGEAALVADLARRLRGFGLSSSIGLADGFGAAHALAWTATSPALVRIAPPGGNLQALAPLPAEGLRLDGDCVRLLRRLGLKTIGDIAAIPRSALERRFRSRVARTGEMGERVLMRLDQALGVRAEPRRPLVEPPCTSVEALFPDPLIASEGLMAETGRLVERLCGHLAELGLGARVVRLSLYRSDGTTAEAGIGTSRPERDPVHLIRLMSEKIAGLDLGFGVDLVRLEAVRAEALPAGQGSLTVPAAGLVWPGAETGVQERLVDRLVNRLGAGRVTRKVARASHWPERAETAVPALRGAGGAGGWRVVSRSPRPVLLLDPPEPIEVMAEVPEGAPFRFTWRRVSHRVVRAAGPERIEPEWWREAGGGGGWESDGPGRRGLARVRDYYRVEDAAGVRFWLFRSGRYSGEDAEGVVEDGADGEEERSGPVWFVHGLFA